MGVIFKNGVPYGEFDRNNLEIITIPLEEVEDKKEDLIYVVKENIEAAEGEAWCWDGEKAIRIGKAGGGSIELDIDEDIIPLGDGEGNLKNSGMKYFNYVKTKPVAGKGFPQDFPGISDFIIQETLYFFNGVGGSVNVVEQYALDDEITEFDFKVNQKDSDTLVFSVNDNSLDILISELSDETKAFDIPNTDLKVWVRTNNSDYDGTMYYHTAFTIRPFTFSIDVDNPPVFSTKVLKATQSFNSSSPFSMSCYGYLYSSDLMKSKSLSGIKYKKSSIEVRTDPIVYESVKPDIEIVADENVLQFPNNKPFKIISAENLDAVDREVYLDKNGHLILENSKGEDKSELIIHGGGSFIMQNKRIIGNDTYNFTLTFTKEDNHYNWREQDVQNYVNNTTNITNDISKASYSANNINISPSATFTLKHQDIISEGYKIKNQEASYEILSIDEPENRIYYKITYNVTYCVVESYYGKQMLDLKYMFMKYNNTSIGTSSVNKPIISFSGIPKIDLKDSASIIMSESSKLQLQGKPDILIESNPKILIGSVKHEYTKSYIPRMHDEYNNKTEEKITINIKGSSDIHMEHYASIQMFGSSYVNLDHFAELNLLGESMIRTNGMSGIYLTDDAYNFTGSTSEMRAPTITKCCLSPTIQANPNQVIIGSIGCGSGKTYTNHLSGNRNKLILIYNKLDKNPSTPLNKSELLSLSTISWDLYDKYRSSINPTAQNSDKVLKLRTLSESLSTLARSLPDDTSTVAIPTGDINYVLEYINAFLTPVLLYESSTFMNIGGLKGHVDINIKPGKYEHVQLFMHNNSFIHHSGNSHEELHDNSRLIMRGPTEEPWLAGFEYDDELTGGKWTSPIQNANGPLVGMYGAPTLVMREEWGDFIRPTTTKEKSFRKSDKGISGVAQTGYDMEIVKTTNPVVYQAIMQEFESKLSSYGYTFLRGGRITEYAYSNTAKTLKIRYSGYYMKLSNGNEYFDTIDYQSGRTFTITGLEEDDFYRDYAIPFTALDESYYNAIKDSIELSDYEIMGVYNYSDDEIIRKGYSYVDLSIKYISTVEWSPETNKIEGNPFVELVGDADLRMDKNGITINGVNFTNEQLQSLKDLLVNPQQTLDSIDNLVGGGIN